MILVLPGEIAVPLPDRVEAARNEISAWAERTGNNIEDVAYRAGGRVISAGQRDKNLRVLGFINTTEPSIEFSNELFKQSTGGRLTIEQSQQEFFNKTGKEITGETIETLYTDEFKAREILMNNPAIHKAYREILDSNTPRNVDVATLNNDDIDVITIDGTKWNKFGFAKSALHDGFSNVKLVAEDGYREAVFDKGTGLLVDNIVEKGTFNFFDPKLYPTAHILTDVDPYVELGN